MPGVSGPPRLWTSDASAAAPATLWVILSMRAVPDSAAGRDTRALKGPLRAMSTDRFLTLEDVADILNITGSQIYALVRGGELRAVKIGGRGQWRVEREQLEAYIARLYEQTERFIAEHPLTEGDRRATQD